MATPAAEEAGAAKGDDPARSRVLIEDLRVLRRKLHILKSEYPLLAERHRAAVSDLSAARARLDPARTRLEASQHALASSRTALETLRATAASLAETIESRADPGAPGLSTLEAARRELAREKVRLSSVRRDAADEIRLLRSKGSALEERRGALDAAVTSLQARCEEYRETVAVGRGDAARARTLAQGREDARLRRVFDLPSDETQLSSYSCATAILPGRITVTTGYVCFESDLGTNRRALHINTIESVRPVVSGLSLSGVEITYDGGKRVTYGNLLNRSSLVRNIRRIATYHRRKIPIEGDD